MKRAKKEPRILTCPEFLMTPDDWLKSKGQELKHDAVDALQRLASYASRMPGLDDDACDDWDPRADDDDDDDFEYTELALIAMAEGEIRLVMHQDNLRKVWQALSAEARSAKEGLQIAHSVLAKLNCLDGLSLESIRGFLQPRVPPAELSGWMSAMDDALDAFRNGGSAMPGFKEEGANHVPEIATYPRWLLAVAYALLDPDRVKRRGKRPVWATLPG